CAGLCARSQPRPQVLQQVQALARDRQNRGPETPRGGGGAQGRRMGLGDASRHGGRQVLGRGRRRGRDRLRRFAWWHGRSIGQAGGGDQGERHRAFAHARVVSLGETGRTRPGGGWGGKGWVGGGRRGAPRGGRG